MAATNVTTSQVSIVSTDIILGISVATFVPGAIGLILNVLVFTRPALRREPCALYFLIATFFNLFIVFIVIPVRILSNGFNTDQGSYNRGICKLETFTFNASRAVSCWLIALACVDRYLHSSANIRIRRISSLKTARIASGITSFTILILYSHLLVYYDINYSTNQAGTISSSCSCKITNYNSFFAYWHMIMYSLFPSFLMVLFGLLTVNNVRRRRQVLGMRDVNNRNTRRMSSDLLLMLAAQVMVTILSTLPFSVMRIYFIITANVPRDSLRLAQETIASSVVVTIPYFAHTSSFYLYTLTGTVFRKELFTILGRCWCCKQNRVHIAHAPANQISVLQPSRQVDNIPK
jgi:hypothetical protein